MSLFLCNLWPYLVGGLIGWLLSGWFARRLKYSEPPEQKIVEKKIEIEKIIDNPEHLSLISALKSENSEIANLKSRITTFENAKPEIIEKEVEKIVEVDNPEHLKRITGLEQEIAQIAGLRSKITELENRKPETVDNPEHLSLISSLKSENSEIANLKTQITTFENAKPEIIEKEIEKIVEIDNPQHLVTIKELEGKIERWKRGSAINLSAAQATGIKIQQEDDFSAIEGIGPAISKLIHDADIHSFRELSETEPSTIQKILDNAGSSFKTSNPGTWPDQANLAASNRWPALKALQDILVGGIYPDTSANKAGESKTVDNPEHVARISSLENELEALRKGPELDLTLAKAAGFTVKRQGNQDDFTVIEGIGPKINELIHAANIHTYKELAGTEVDKIKNILDQAGSNFALAKPDTWPEQSELAAENRWGILRKWQDVLDGGEE